MRLAIFASSLASGGAERVALNLTREFSRAGHAVDLVVLNAEGALLADVPEAVRLVDLGAVRASKSIAPLRRYLVAESPDAILAINFEANLAASLAALVARSRALLVLSIHMPIRPWLDAFPLARRQLMDLASRFAYTRAGPIVAPSAGIARDLERFGWARSDQVTVIHNPVLSERVDQLSAEPVNDPWLTDAQIPCIVALGRLTPLKNHALLISAFRLLLERRNARLLVIGEGECRIALEQQISSLRLSNHVRLAGYVANPFPLLRAADLFVLSSDYEGFGNVLVEAMAVGTPVVATDCPYGPREILEDGRWGLLVPPQEPEALAAAMIETLDRPAPFLLQRAAEFGAAARSAEYLQLIGAALAEAQESRGSTRRGA